MADTALTKGVVSTADWINKILVFSLLLTVTLLVAKILDVSKIEIAKLDVPIQFAWVAFVALTVAHLYVMLVFVSKCARLFFTDHSNAATTWDSLTHEGPLFFRGMIPRHYTGNGPAVMSFADPTTWLIHGAAVLFFVALVPWVPFGQLTWLSIAPAIGLTFLNWMIGSLWAIAASELKRNEDTSSYLRAFFRE